MSTRVSIIFPYLGDEDAIRERLTAIIRETIFNRHLHNSNMRPVLIVNRDTINKGIYKKFEEYLLAEGEAGLVDKLDVIPVWAVDTCQMWLHGFGKIIDDKKSEPADNTESILQIPGDLKYVHDFGEFVRELGYLRMGIETAWDFAIGDFTVEDKGSKDLIDVYGTYPLLYNWFPEIANELREHLKIKRPRSEFIAAKLEFLSSMLAKRKFAYEQTLAFLIHALSENRGQNKISKWQIERVKLGSISDYEQGRGFREANDQIERTERLLKLLWREMNGRDDFPVREFERLQRRSTAIREAAIVALRNFLMPDRQVPQDLHDISEEVRLLKEEVHWLKESLDALHATFQAGQGAQSDEPNS